MGAEEMEKGVGLLPALSEARGVSGDEGAVRGLILDAVRPYIDEHWVDTIGNLFAVRKARAKSDKKVPQKVMVSGHMDEVGLMIVNIENSGLLRFQTIGLDQRLLLSKKVLIGDKMVPGVIGSKAIHLTTPEERSRPVPVDQMAIDIGVSSKSEAEKVVQVGDYAVFATRFADLGHRVKGKAFDDRVGCAVLIELLKADYPFDLYGVFTVQEEMGLRGARVAAFAVDPDAGIALEGTICDELPRERDVPTATKLDHGPAITVADRSFIAHHGFLGHAVSTAEALGIPYQFKQPGLGGTDSGAMHLTKEGVPSLAISTPCRYIHSPAAIMSKADFWSTVRLVREMLSSLTMDVLQPQ